MEINISIDFIRIECGACGTIFWISDRLNKNLIETKEGFYCPNGHERAYVKSRADKLQEQVDIKNQIINDKDDHILKLEKELKDHIPKLNKKSKKKK